MALGLHPRVKMPTWAAVAIVAAAYVFRSAMRGWDFTPDAFDLLMFGALAVIIVARVALTRSVVEQDASDTEDTDAGPRD